MDYVRRAGKKGTFQIYRRIPSRFKDLGLPVFFKRSLKTEDQTIALRKSQAIWKQCMMEWEALLAGDHATADVYHRKVADLAEQLGFPYLEADDVTSEPLPTVLQRIEVLDPDNRAKSDALLGGISAPKIPLSSVVAEYEALSESDNAEKSEKQLLKWRLGVERTISAFIKCVGDLDLEDVTPSHATRYKLALTQRVKAGEIAPYTANREMYTLNRAINEVHKHNTGKELRPFAGLLVKVKKTKKRPRQVSFETDWIIQNILAPGALSGLNREAQDFVRMMVNTPARHSELAALRSGTIHLDHEVPHISIEADGRQLKSVSAERKLPLVGLSLEIIKRYPEGFERYRDKADNVSAVVMKYFRTNDLLPSPAHKLYSLRHSLSDRLLNDGCTEAVKDELMGHEQDGTPYGDGLWLKTAQERLLRVCLE